MARGFEVARDRALKVWEKAPNDYLSDTSRRMGGWIMMAELHLWDEDTQRRGTAERLHATIQDQSSVSFDHVAAIAKGMKSANPDLAERIDRVVGHSMLRAMLLPEMLTSLFWAQTEAPPEVIEGEIVEDPPLEGEVEDLEVQDE